jgi:tetratricopeptide (TPR) repeat protein
MERLGAPVNYVMEVSMSHRSTLEVVVLPGEIACAPVRTRGSAVLARPRAIGLALALIVTAAVTPVRGAANCTAEQGQLFIDEGRYKQAIGEFTCVIEAEPTEVEGYRGRIEAQLLLGQYSNSVRDYARVTAIVTPVHPDAQANILASYAGRLETVPNDIPALTGASFSRWWYFDYLGAIHLLDQLLDLEPGNPYGNLFRGSSRLLKGHAVADGVVDLDYAIALAPESPDVRYIVADAYTYGLPDPDRAFAEATFALEGGLDTPRVHAILGSAYSAFGDQAAAATHIATHIQLVTTELLTTSPLPARASMALDLVPGQTYEIPLVVSGGEMISIVTSAHDYWDTILVLLDPDGSPVLGSDDSWKYFAAFDWIAPSSGTHRMRVTFFEGVITGTLLVSRK